MAEKLWILEDLENAVSQLGDALEINADHDLIKAGASSILNSVLNWPGKRSKSLVNKWGCRIACHQEPVCVRPSHKAG